MWEGVCVVPLLTLRARGVLSLRPPGAKKLGGAIDFAPDSAVAKAAPVAAKPKAKPKLDAFDRDGSFGGGGFGDDNDDDEGEATSTTLSPCNVT